jgi:hypothetical protein
MSIIHQPGIRFFCTRIRFVVCHGWFFEVGYLCTCQLLLKVLKWHWFRLHVCKSKVVVVVVVLFLFLFLFLLCLLDKLCFKSFLRLRKWYAKTWGTKSLRRSTRRRIPGNYAEWLQCFFSNLGMDRNPGRQYLNIYSCSVCSQRCTPRVNITNCCTWMLIRRTIEMFSVFVCMIYVYFPSTWDVFLLIISRTSCWVDVFLCGWIIRSITSTANGMTIPLDNMFYPLVNVYITMEHHHAIFMGKTTISTGPCSIVFCMFTGGYE